VFLILAVLWEPSIAYDIAGISDYMADINFIELFGTPADIFPVNY